MKQVTIKKHARNQSKLETMEFFQGAPNSSPGRGHKFVTIGLTEFRKYLQSQMGLTSYQVAKNYGKVWYQSLGAA